MKVWSCFVLLKSVLLISWCVLDVCYNNDRRYYLCPCIIAAQTPTGFRQPLSFGCSPLIVPASAARCLTPEYGRSLFPERIGLVTSAPSWSTNHHRALTSDLRLTDLAQLLSTAACCLSFPVWGHCQDK